jgi:hypothetical protein
VSSGEPGGDAPPSQTFASEPGWCSREVEEELPGLALTGTRVVVTRPGPLTGPSPPDVKERLRELSNRYRGAAAVNVRRDPIPVAYRIFFRQIGLDPDLARTPIEGAVLERMMQGGFLSGGLLEDVLLIALADTGVPVWALDAERVDGPLGIRSSVEGEHLGRAPDAPELAAGRLVIADARSPLALLFGELAAAHAPKKGARELVLFSVRVAGVPELYAEEALWSVRSALEWG